MTMVDATGLYSDWSARNVLFWTLIFVSSAAYVGVTITMWIATDRPQSRAAYRLIPILWAVGLAATLTFVWMLGGPLQWFVYPLAVLVATMGIVAWWKWGQEEQQRWMPRQGLDLAPGSPRTVIAMRWNATAPESRTRCATLITDMVDTATRHPYGFIVLISSVNMPSDEDILEAVRDRLAGPYGDQPSHSDAQ